MSDYIWIGPNDFTSTLQNPIIDNVTIAAAGTYTLTVTDIYGCMASSETIVTIYPTPTADSPDDQAFCFGETTPVIPLTGTPEGVVFDISGGTSIGLPNQTGVTEIPSFIALTGTATITITPHANGCTGSPVTFIIQVFPLPNVIAIPSSQTICSGAYTNINLTSNVPNTTFSWIIFSITPPGSIAGALDDDGNQIIQQLFNNITSNAVVIYKVYPHANNCTGIPVNVTITVKPPHTLIINDPDPVCTPSTVDLTDPSITEGSSPNLIFTYWLDAAATMPLPNPSSVSTSGTYYIKGLDPSTNCYTIKPVVVIINSSPTLVINNPEPECIPATVDITDESITEGSTPGLIFTYWYDAEATVPYPTPETAENGTYYIKGTTDLGCYDIQPVVVTIYSDLGIPVFELGEFSTACSGSEPIIYSATAENAITLTYSLDPTSLAAGNTINPNTGEVTFASGYTGTILITATATGCGPNTTAIHSVTVLPSPTVSLVASPTTICEGESTTLTATNSGGIIMDSYSGTSGNVNLNIPNNSNTQYANSIITLTGSMGATLAPSDILIITLNITHQYDADLDIFLIDPTFTRAMLLSSDNGNDGNDYRNTVLRTDATNVIGTAGNNTAPFTGTYRPEGTITTVPDRTGAANFGNYNLVVPANALNGAPIDGNWTLRVFDDATHWWWIQNTGSLDNWSIEIIKPIGSGYTTEISGPPIIGDVIYSGANSTTATAVVTPPVGTHIYTAITLDGNHCEGISNQVTIVVNPLPQADITADYCSDPNGMILLTAHPDNMSYLWSTGQTTQQIAVDIVGIYSVTVTNPATGCHKTDFLDVSIEMVEDGHFTNFNPSDVTFYTEYELRQELYYGGDWTYYRPNYAGYAVHESAWAGCDPCDWVGCCPNPIGGHPGWHGRDHTNNTVGPRNFMLVDGAQEPLVIWQNEIDVDPGTTYYFSAWAMNVECAHPAGELQFEINGTPIGISADLNAPDYVNNHCPSNEAKVNLDNWVRFWGEWTADAETAIVKIVNLDLFETGNDFGLDDISFGTLQPPPLIIDPEVEGENSSVCEGETIQLLSNVTNGLEPFTFLWEGPEDFSSTEEDPAIPNSILANGGEYTLTVWDASGCPPVSQTFIVYVIASAKVNAGEDQVLCASSPTTIQLNGSISGSASSSLWSTSGDGSFDDIYEPITIYNCGTQDIIDGSVILTLTTNDPDGVCPSVSDDMTIIFHPAVSVIITEIIPPLCYGYSDGSITASATEGTAPFQYSWNTVPVQNTPTAINLAAGTYAITVTDANGCTSSETVTLPEPEPLIIDEEVQYTEPSCYNGNDGTAWVTIISGESPTYLWSNGQTDPVATGLSAGVYWVTITSANDCSSTSLIVVITQPDPPDIDCPGNIITSPNPGYNYATVTIDPPLITAPGITYLTWEASPPSAGNGNGLIPDDWHFYSGVTTVTYTITDDCGNIADCSFTVTVLGAADLLITKSAYSVFIEDGEPIIYYDQAFTGGELIYTITVTNNGPAEAVNIIINDVILVLPLPLFSTDLITWNPWVTPYNVGNLGAGSSITLYIKGTVPIDHCENIGNTASVTSDTEDDDIDNNSVTISTQVEDNDPPTFATPGPFEFCVLDIYSALYDGEPEPWADIIPGRPDWYIVNDELDLDENAFSDNCCDPDESDEFIVYWRIDFDDGSFIPPLPDEYISGQPSAYPGGILLPGDGVNFEDLYHTITYRLEDCNGNLSDPVSFIITVKPRPDVQKVP
ncbi:MAG TPA: HYR domain-containing protein [Bacteroidales bacterium]|nr:HYR domain-containing protein [Bacteroidales bacterium]